MMRVRLKADGRLVAILPDGSEGPLPDLGDQAVREIPGPPLVPDGQAGRAGGAAQGLIATDTASYARRIRANVRLTQAEFANRIGVPVETVRNWEQGKRAPRGPARALLKLIEQAPEMAFSVLRQR
jgi:putative transcriptional regulator